MVELKHNVFGSTGTQPAQQQVEDSSEKKPMANLDLRSLIELGCVKDELVIGDMTFRMRSLNVSERREIGTFLGDLENLDPDKLFDSNMLILAMSIEAVNDQPLESLYDGAPVDALTAKRVLLSNMQNSVLTKLLDFYTEISDRADAQFTPDQVKN